MMRLKTGKTNFFNFKTNMKYLNQNVLNINKKLKTIIY